MQTYGCRQKRNPLLFQKKAGRSSVEWQRNSALLSGCNQCRISTKNCKDNRKEFIVQTHVIRGDPASRTLTVLLRNGTRAVTQPTKASTTYRTQALRDEEQTDSSD